MKKTKDLALVIMFTLLVLCQSCGDGSVADRYDHRLTAADSLLHMNNPDSALQVLSAIDGTVLHSASERAYHALLLTQAQYRCYVAINSDSTINVALNYYQRGRGEQEKLTRAYIYKGAVTEVLGAPEDAMRYYKQAVSVAAPDDHFNLGYAKMRLGCLYRNYLVADSSAITDLKDALSCFEQANDRYYVFNCLSAIGGIYAAKNIRDSAVVYLERAEAEAKKLQRKRDELTNMMYLIDMRMFSGDVKEIKQAKTSALRLLESENLESKSRDHLLLDAAYTLALLNKPDSALLYLNQVDKDGQSDGMSVLYESCLAEIARCRNNSEQFKVHYDIANNLSDSLVNNKMQMQLRDVEAKYDNEALKYKALKYKSNWQVSLLGSLLVVSILAIALILIARRASQRKHQLASSEDTIERMQGDTARLEAMLEANHEMSEGLKATIRHQIDTFTQLVEAHYTQFTHHPKKFDELFKQAYGLNQPDLSFWAGLRTYADSTCNNIIIRTLEEHPSLGEGDVRFLSLCCCDLPTSVIMACLGYNSLHSVYRKKRHLAHKMGLTGKLDDYIADARTCRLVPAY